MHVPRPPVVHRKLPVRGLRAAFPAISAAAFDEVERLLRQTDLVGDYVRGDVRALVEEVRRTAHEAHEAYLWETGDSWTARSATALLRTAASAYLAHLCLERVLAAPALFFDEEPTPRKVVDVHRHLRRGLERDFFASVRECAKLKQYWKRNPRPLFGELLRRVDQLLHDLSAGGDACRHRAADDLLRVTVLALLVRDLLQRGRRFKRSRAPKELETCRLAAAAEAEAEAAEDEEDDEDEDDDDDLRYS